MSRTDEPWTTPRPHTTSWENTMEGRGLIYDPIDTTLALGRWLAFTGVAAAATLALAGIRMWRHWATITDEIGD